MKCEELRLLGLRKVYGAVEAVAGLDLAVKPGTTLTLLGPSGCGKTTLLRMIAGLVAPTAGQIVLGDVDITHVPSARRDIGVVFQNYALFPHLTVEDNVGFGLRARKRPAGEIAEHVRRMLSLVKLDGYGGRYPAQLSGGQQQRAALARALAIDPKLLLLDEPLSALDKSLRQSVQRELRQLQRELGITTVIVTHDQEEAFVLSDRVAIMSAGRIVQAGTPQSIYDAPFNRFVAEFLGNGNFIPGRVTGTQAGELEIELSGGVRVSLPGEPTPIGVVVDLFVRPEELQITSEEDPVQGGMLAVSATLIETRLVAGRIETHVRLMDGTRLLSHRLRHGRPEIDGVPGMSLRVCINPQAVLVMQR
jgi:putative spermidine/putrescine transport system ATP-binding protein